MKRLNKLLNENAARTASGFMENICYLVLLIFVFGMVLSFIGRQEFRLITSSGSYDNAILAEEKHNWQRPGNTRWLTIKMNDDVFVWGADKIDVPAKVAISAIYAVYIIPLIVSFWLLSRVFRSVRKGYVFTERNAAYILYFGLIRIAASVLVPLVKIGIVNLVNWFSNSSMRINTGKGWLTELITSIAFIVAAYIIHYGVQLQDEVDHTL